MRAPVVLLEDAVLLVTLVIPSSSAVEPNNAPVIPTPPVTLRAPVVLEEDTVESVTLTLSASTSSKLTCVA